MRITIIIFFLPMILHAQEQSFRNIKQNATLRSDSSSVYSLPYENGKSHLLVQGSGGSLSHKGETALDFKLRKGTKICAMREGKVIEIKEDSDKRGLKRKFFAAGNFILVQHDDKSYAWYFHLQKDGVFVQPGDTVKRGQVIGKSGNTGYSAFPHLHVELVVEDSGGYKQIPMRFQLRNGVDYLRPGRFYRRQD